MPHDYTGNSNKDKEKRVAPQEDKVIEQVTTGVVVKKKPPLGQRIKTLIFGGDARGASKYIAADVLLPAIRNLVVDATTKGIERIVYGESSRPTLRRPGYDYRSRIQYNSPIMRSDPRSPVRLPDQTPRTMRREANDLVLASREEAELVLERLFDIIDKYEVASQADLYDLTGLPSSHVDNKWGWTNLHNTEVRQVREGFLLDLPPAEEI
jgi:hypothetical protein